MPFWQNGCPQQKAERLPERAGTFQNHTKLSDERHLKSPSPGQNGSKSYVTAGLCRIHSIETCMPADSKQSLVRTEQAVPAVTRHLMLGIGGLQLWLFATAAVDNMRATGVEFASSRLICR